MPCWLLVLNDGGYPLFSRSYGLPSAAFSFATMGLLSAVHSSAGNTGFGVRRLSSHDAHLSYRSCTGGIILVFASSDVHADEEDMDRRMGQMYDAIVFVNGKNKIQDTRNVERTKRQIRSAAPLLSLFLLDDSFLLHMCTGLPEVCLLDDSLFTTVSTLAGLCGTRHAALYAGGRLGAWTADWCLLDGRDLFTVACFLRSATPAQARDVPVYLAHSTLGGTQASVGRTPYRLLTIAIATQMELVLLCGPSPTIVDAMQLVTSTILGQPTSSKHKQVLSPMHASLMASRVDFTRHVHSEFTFHEDMLGFMLVCHADKLVGGDESRAKIVTSFLPGAPVQPLAKGKEKEKGRRSPSPSRKSHPAVEPPSPSPFAPDNPLYAGSLLSDTVVLQRSHALLGFYQLVKSELDETDGPGPQVDEAYMIAPHRGFFACKRGPHRLYVMFAEKVPQTSHGPLTRELMDKLETITHRL